MIGFLVGHFMIRVSLGFVRSKPRGMISLAQVSANHTREFKLLNDIRERKMNAQVSWRPPALPPPAAALALGGCEGPLANQA